MLNLDNLGEDLSSTFLEFQYIDIDFYQLAMCSSFNWRERFSEEDRHSTRKQSFEKLWELGFSLPQIEKEVESILRGEVASLYAVPLNELGNRDFRIQFKNNFRVPDYQPATMKKVIENFLPKFRYQELSV